MFGCGFGSDERARTPNKVKTAFVGLEIKKCAVIRVKENEL